MNRIVELYKNAIDNKEFSNLKVDVIKLISNSSICDVERKVCKKDNKKDSDVKRKGRKKDNNKNVNKDKDKDNLTDKLLNNNKDKLHNFSDKVLNNLINFAKLKEKILINRKKVKEINIPINDIRPNLDKYKELNMMI